MQKKRKRTNSNAPHNVARREQRKCRKANGKWSWLSGNVNISYFFIISNGEQRRHDTVFRGCWWCFRGAACFFCLSAFLYTHSSFVPNARVKLLIVRVKDIGIWNILLCKYLHCAVVVKTSNSRNITLPIHSALSVNSDTRASQRTPFFLMLIWEIIGFSLFALHFSECANNNNRKQIQFTIYYSQHIKVVYSLSWQRRQQQQQHMYTRNS